MPSTEALAAGRYASLELAGEGAFAEVFRATDLERGCPVAVKRLRAGAGDPGTLERFERECRLLARIDSPHVVRYVDHGLDVGGRPWLVLEWLVGKDLAQRQATAPLSGREAVEACRQACLGLAALHELGIVHRDVKPGNFFVLEGDPPTVKLIDLGVARASDEALLTSAGLRVGTPAYMSPEQAAGDPEVGPGSDLYSLAVVLFELLCGRRPFTSADPVALLAKIVLEEPPLLRALVSSAPPELDALLRRAMSKHAAGRPASALVMAEALGRIVVPDLPTHPTRENQPTARVARSAPPTGEARVVTAVFVRFPRGDRAGPPPAELVEALAAQHGATAHRLLARRFVLAFGERRSTGDEPIRAARAALALKQAAPDVRLALATDRALAGRSGLAGAVIDRGAAMLERAGASVRLDALSGRLLASHFLVVGVAGEGEDLELRGERSLSEGAAPRLLGRETRLLGREQELQDLLDVVERAASTVRPTSAVVLAGPGMGKSRLRHELVGRLAAAPAPPRVLLLRGDPTVATVPLGALAHALRREARVRPNAAHEVRRAAADRFAAAIVPAQDVRLVRELLGVADEADPAVRAMREDPVALSASLRALAAELLPALGGDRPVVVLVEDAHWVDDRTLGALEYALDEASTALSVLAFARPELTDLRGRPFASADPLWIELRGLGHRVAETLVRDVLGAEVPGETVATIVLRADGNPLFLEELVRAVVQDGDAGTGLPLAIQAAFQVRIDALPSPAKEALLAASVAGRAVYRDALVAMLPRREVDLCLDVLRQWEVLAERPRTRFSGVRELVFRHALLRDVAYAMLSDELRVRYHGDFADWLEQAGEEDAATLAHHQELAGRRERAVGLYERAARHAQREGAWEICLGHVERAAALGPPLEHQARLRVMAHRACHRLGRYTEALAHLERGEAASPGRATALRLGAGRCLTYRRLGRLDESRAAVEVLLEDGAAPAADDERRAEIEARAELAWTLYNGGSSGRARPMAEELRGAVAALPSPAPALELSVVHVLARCHHALGDLEAALEAHRLVVARGNELGHLWRAEGARHGLGQVLIALGRLDEAVTQLEQARARGRALGLPSTEGYALLYLAVAHAFAGRPAEAREAAIGAGRAGERLGAPPLVAAAGLWSGYAERALGDLVAARARVEAIAVDGAASRGVLRASRALGLLLSDEPAADAVAALAADLRAAPSGDGEADALAARLLAELGSAEVSAPDP